MNSKAAPAPTTSVYREWLVPSVANFVAAAILLPSCYLVFLPIEPGAGFWIGTFLTLAIWAGMLAASARIEVQNGELRVGKAKIPTKFLIQGRKISPEQRFGERGPELDARAYVRFQIGVKPLVRFENVDESDPTPYWLFSTRRPAELIEAIESFQPR